MNAPSCNGVNFFPPIYLCSRSFQRPHRPWKLRLSSLNISTIVLPISKEYSEKHFCTKTTAVSSWLNPYMWVLRCCLTRVFPLWVQGLFHSLCKLLGSFIRPLRFFLPERSRRELLSHKLASQSMVQGCGEHLPPASVRESYHTIKDRIVYRNIVIYYIVTYYVFVSKYIYKHALIYMYVLCTGIRT